jgi:hypothetical protein
MMTPTINTAVLTSFLSVFFVTTPGLCTQPAHTIRGKIVDAVNGEPLPSATIRVSGTSLGTIANAHGEFRYTLPDTAAALVVSYIGYNSDTVASSSSINRFVLIKLRPNPIQMAEVIVTGEDPAYEIIRAAIRNKKKWMERLRSYEGKAFSRIVIRAQDSIAAITEAYSTLYWRTGDSLREVITQQKQTGNLPKTVPPARVHTVINFNDDTIALGGFRFTGPTAPDAFDYYDYKLLSTREMDNFDVYRIRVIPKSRISPLFKGTIDIAQHSYAVIEADLEPNEAYVQPFVNFTEAHYSESFRLFDNAFWLPAHFRIDLGIAISVMGIKIPPIGIERDVVIYEYLVNPALPDSLLALGTVVVDSSAKKIDSTFWASHDVLPQTAEQDSAYRKLDSTQTLEKQFAPSGAAVSFMKTSTTGLLSYLDLSFNRVEAWHLGVSKTIDTLTDGVGVRGGAAYGTADRRWKWNAGATFEFGPPLRRSATIGVAAVSFSERRWSLSFDAYDQVDEFPLVLLKDRFFNGLGALIDHVDAYDYYSRRGASASLSYLPAPHWRLTLGGLSERQSSLTKNTEYSFFNRSNRYRDNPSVVEGWMNALTLGAAYATTAMPGMEKNAFTASASAEISPSQFSDFSFAQLNMTLRGKISTMDYNLLFPPALTVVVTAGMATGHLPPQRYFSLASNVFSVGGHGMLHGTGPREFYGDRYALCSVEYNFRRAPFALTGIRWLYESKLEFIIVGAVARTWFSGQTLRVPDFPVNDTQGWYSEAGVGVSNVLDLFRVDLTYRFKQPRQFVLTLLLSDFVEGLMQQNGRH